VLSDEGIAYALDERLPVTDIPGPLRALAQARRRSRPTVPLGGHKTPDRIPVSRLIDISQKVTIFTLSRTTQMSADDIEKTSWLFVGEQLHLADWLKAWPKLPGKKLSRRRKRNSSFSPQQTKKKNRRRQRCGVRRANGFAPGCRHGPRSLQESRAQPAGSLGANPGGKISHRRPGWAG
jgi:hypothetical protein